MQDAGFIRSSSVAFLNIVAFIRYLNGFCGINQFVIYTVIRKLFYFCISSLSNTSRMKILRVKWRSETCSKQKSHWKRWQYYIQSIPVQSNTWRSEIVFLLGIIEKCQVRLIYVADHDPMKRDCPKIILAILHEANSQFDNTVLFFLLQRNSRGDLRISSSVRFSAKVANHYVIHLSSEGTTQGDHLSMLFFA